MTTTLADKNGERQWYLLNAENQNLGRLSVRIANILRGKHKPSYTPHIDNGDYVIIINSLLVNLTGKKRKNKSYMFYTGYRGNEYNLSFESYQKKDPNRIIFRAVQGMMPKNKLARQMLKKLKIYSGKEHNHKNQKKLILS